MNIGIRPSSLAVVTAVLGLLARPPVVDAQWPQPARKAAEKLVTGVFYLRVDAPCDYNRVVPMLDVSPDGADTRRIADLSPQDRDNVEWLFGPNDAVGRFSLRWGITSVRLWGQGMGSSRHEVLIDFVRIKNLDDFKKALELSFSRTPLPDAHPDWPADVRKAVVERRVVEGMMREQAAAVVGLPASVEKPATAGAEVEIWRFREVRADKKSDWAVRIQGGLPSSLKFEGGVLKAIERAPSSTGKK